ncbi:MAG: TetR/AcrR family transcriptional regulator [Opitutaceae bacterium]
MLATVKISAVSSSAVSDELNHRILNQARTDFLIRGYSSVTMDAIASELGISKKTLYQHFSSKDALIGDVILGLSREMRAEADVLLSNHQLNFAEKLRGFAKSLAQRWHTITPHAVRDLKRFAPHLHALLHEVRQKDIPHLFGRFVEQGQLTGMVRDDLQPDLTIHFYLNALQGLLQPNSLEQLKLTPTEVCTRAIDLFFGGLLTPAGFKEHEKLFPR